MMTEQTRYISRIRDFTPMVLADELDYHREMISSQAYPDGYSEDMVIDRIAAIKLVMRENTEREAHECELYDSGLGGEYED